MSWWKPTTNDQLAVLLYEVLLNQERIISNQAQGTRIMSAISDAVAALQAQVAQQTTVEQSATTLIQGIAAQLTAALSNAKDDAAAVAAVTTITQTLQTSASSLSTAVSANTPTAPPAP